MTQTATDKLLPCPFCGGEATSMPVYNCWGVACSNGCCERGGAYQEDAEEEWNTRHNPDAMKGSKMTNATDKLIADNLWQDISEAPRDNYSGFLMTDGDIQVVGCYKYGKLQVAWDGNTEFSTWTHFRPLPDDRCANALKIAVEALLKAATTVPYHSQGWNEKLQRYESSPKSLEEELCARVVHMNTIIVKALAEIERIAEKGE